MENNSTSSSRQTTSFCLSLDFFSKMATMEQFSLRWNNFHSNLTSGFHDLLQAADMVDVTLAVEGQFLQAHKIVLSICSPYFKQLFKVNPCKHPIVILKDVAHGNMKDILEFMYLGEVNVLKDNLTSFLRTAELLQVKGLTGDDSVSCLFVYLLSATIQSKFVCFCDCAVTTNLFNMYVSGT